jgi:hypothetical protein
MISKILNAIQAADAAGMLQIQKSDVLTGFSSKKMVGALQRQSALYADAEKACYVEVGVFQGLTLLSVADSNPTVQCFGIENFAQLDQEGRNHQIVVDRAQALGITNATVLNADYEDAFEQLSARIDGRRLSVYFVDGPHDYRSQLMCLLLAVPHIHERGVVIVDDANYAHVRQANHDFLTSHPEFKLVFEAYTPAHPSNRTDEDRELTISGWWNGVNIIVRDPDDELPPMYPPTERSRTLFENEHLLHSHMLRDHFPQIAARMAEIITSELRRFPRLAWRYVRWLWRLRALKFGATYTQLNTFSEQLPSTRYNSLR